ncbi:hypothetical protein SAICODRAFT_8010 [Saitoella complicata NRRL Y-17804]|uniref:Uncharacterized protein n=1 Tax=Saitoella complicata (strain BCRC 22490 / CBS 7301 / JCM 7358 / NBRC 10748 / NRRL Y-17804) TaxID=698492 RepID=A0A0E9NCK1_SAICN|nr:uncharacterized protein SAICODRAFT_8010 [Saitoella complicata NRRL Y-17804]ODQ52580.1 hypothetical protein SAICODRAFT_8010 [Saitoella complicata NRRL Y-17804]GAO47528.1 hypothetical protein G7K_1733-t1 [Saitoella complicata NRRL Y-17804]
MAHLGIFKCEPNLNQQAGKLLRFDWLNGSPPWTEPEAEYFSKQIYEGIRARLTERGLMDKCTGHAVNEENPKDQFHIFFRFHDKASAKSVARALDGKPHYIDLKYEDGKSVNFRTVDVADGTGKIVESYANLRLYINMSGVRWMDPALDASMPQIDKGSRPVSKDTTDSGTAPGTASGPNPLQPTDATDGNANGSEAVPSSQSKASNNTPDADGQDTQMEDAVAAPVTNSGAQDGVLGKTANTDVKENGKKGSLPDIMVPPVTPVGADFANMRLDTARSQLSTANSNGDTPQTASGPKPKKPKKPDTATFHLAGKGQPTKWLQFDWRREILDMNNFPVRQVNAAKGDIEIEIHHRILQALRRNQIDKFEEEASYALQDGYPLIYLQFESDDIAHGAAKDFDSMEIPLFSTPGNDKHVYLNFEFAVPDPMSVAVLAGRVGSPKILDKLSKEELEWLSTTENAWWEMDLKSRKTIKQAAYLLPRENLNSSKDGDVDTKSALEAAVNNNAGERAEPNLPRSPAQSEESSSPATSRIGSRNKGRKKTLREDSGEESEEEDTTNRRRSGRMAKAKEREAIMSLRPTRRSAPKSMAEESTDEEDAEEDILPYGKSAMQKDLGQSKGSRRKSAPIPAPAGPEDPTQSKLNFAKAKRPRTSLPTNIAAEEEDESSQPKTPKEKPNKKRKKEKDAKKASSDSGAAGPQQAESGPVTNGDGWDVVMGEAPVVPQGLPGTGMARGHAAPPPGVEMTPFRATIPSIAPAPPSASSRFTHFPQPMVGQIPFRAPTGPIQFQEVQFHGAVPFQPAPGSIPPPAPPRVVQQPPPPPVQQPPVQQALAVQEAAPVRDLPENPEEMTENQTIAAEIQEISEPIYFNFWGMDPTARRAFEPVLVHLRTAMRTFIDDGAGAEEVFQEAVYGMCTAFWWVEDLGMARELQAPIQALRDLVLRLRTD